MVHPIIDEYYNYNPYHSRSSQYVQEKGLVTNEKGVNGVATPSGTPSLANGKKSALSASIHDSIASTLIPSMHNRSASPALSPAHEIIPRYSAIPSDLRHLTSVQNLHPQEARTVEQGNTKKKRASISAQDQLNAQPQPSEPEEPDSPPQRTYGGPNKIAQYFPELN